LTTAQLVRDHSEQLQGAVQRVQTQPLELVLAQVRQLERAQVQVQQLEQALLLAQLVHCDRCNRVHLLV